MREKYDFMQEKKIKSREKESRHFVQQITLIILSLVSFHLLEINNDEQQKLKTN